ncbi:hypothetical protein [Rhodomicrobium udaipurense]|uniref:Uncharacterized protein n=1 Tax=Rhodomicrobium udaipurense TaxID=1202716 RepID=A0A8I1GDJ4_9HYPH|nr:hypothetical protein [Rhodomicrobium udaipurense]MBJ7542909.1 hypothetical protein [Rhodomicrobium udaipurense]
MRSHCVNRANADHLGELPPFTMLASRESPRRFCGTITGASLSIPSKATL